MIKLRGLALVASISLMALTTSSLTGCAWFHKHFGHKTAADTVFNTTPPGEFPATGDQGAGVDSGELAGRPAGPREEAGQQVPELRTVFFGFDSSDVSSEGRQILDGDASYLQSNPNMKVQVQGHCDERGTTEYNYALGQRRADSVREYLIQKGIDTNRLNAISYGEDRPIAPGHDEAAYQQNRRVQFMGY